MWERPLCRDSRDTEVSPTLEMINRFPILIGFESARANRSSQLRGNASIQPPNSLSSEVESLRERHTISSSRRLRPGVCAIASWLGACAWRASSCALTQCSSARLRHRYRRYATYKSRSLQTYLCADAPTEIIVFYRRKCRLINDRPESDFWYFSKVIAVCSCTNAKLAIRPKFGRMTAGPFTLISKPLPQMAGDPMCGCLGCDSDFSR